MRLANTPHSSARRRCRNTLHSPFTILSWNVLSTRAYNKYNTPQSKQFHRTRWKHILATVKEHQPVVLLLQEVDRAFLQWFVPRLQAGTKQSWRSVHHSTVSSRTDDFGTCVVYDEGLAPIQAGILRDNDKYWGKDATYIIGRLNNNKKCFICSVHLSGSNDAAHARLIHDVKRRSRGYRYKIISGDFNREMSGISSITELGGTRGSTRTSTLSRQKRNETTCDFDYSTRPKPAPAEIDKCFLSPNLRFVPKSRRAKPYTVFRKLTCKQYSKKSKKTFVQAVGSDHFPIVATIQIIK